MGNGTAGLAGSQHVSKSWADLVPTHDGGAGVSEMTLRIGSPDIVVTS